MQRKTDDRQRCAVLVLLAALPCPVIAETGAFDIALPASRFEAPADAAALDSVCRELTCGPLSPPARLRFGHRPGFGATLVEIPSYSLPGQPQRPRHALGLRSPQLESALNAVGIDARQCLAPMLRMQTKVSSSFDVSGTLWVYLRCALE